MAVLRDDFKPGDLVFYPGGPRRVGVVIAVRPNPLLEHPEWEKKKWVLPRNVYDVRWADGTIGHNIDQKNKLGDYQEVINELQNSLDEHLKNAAELKELFESSAVQILTSPGG